MSDGDLTLCPTRMSVNACRLQNRDLPGLAPENDKRVGKGDGKSDPFYSESNIRRLEKKMEDYKAGRLKLAEHEPIGPESSGSCRNRFFRTGDNNGGKT